MRRRYVADRDGNLIVSALPEPEFEDIASECPGCGTRQGNHPSSCENREDPNVYDGAGHKVGNYL